MSAHYQRACLLYQQNRYDMAASELRLALSQDPNRADYHALLALCLAEQERFDNATEEAQRAIGLGPDMAYTHYVMSRVMLQRNRLNEARTAIQESIRLDPEDADYFHQLSIIELNARNWQASLDAAEQGLQLDPEHVGCANLRVRALAQLGRKTDADAAVEAALQRAPENAFTHANRGWTLLEQSDPTKAMEHFREALRLDPTMDWARQGIVESLKAKHFIYRWMLAYFLWMSRLSSGAQWGVIVGLYVVFQAANYIESNYPALAVVTRPLIVGYLAFFVLSWLARPLFNTLLRLSRFGRMVLNREEVWQSNLVCLFLLPALAAGVVYMIEGKSNLGAYAEYLGLSCGFSAIFVSTVFHCEAGWPRWAMLAGAVVYILASVRFLSSLFQLDMESIAIDDPVLENARYWRNQVVRPLSLILLIAGNVLAAARPKR
jgi:tetratricopeptide (TPR) repeat protein